MADEVPIPEQALSDPAAFEVFRVWFAHNSMFMGLGRRFDDPALWGVILAQVAKEAAKLYANDLGMSQVSALLAMKQQFDEEWIAFSSTIVK
ncbi:DUF5076 domain-containing protein [Devosia sp. CN2-171]|jgi:hypothetical protein|uniref:DUF5076 domain-containing protein n=1 Tax=Devosia sp. CN2-171 TaxID=3400909 RepID=UPI003BF7E421